MIPQRITLRGFLCYKDEQAIEFDGNATLWMLSGLNGSGKSSIFDAVTYALFGHHRGGGTHAQELINKDSDTLSVEFDFLLDGKLLRAKRTLRRDTKGGARGTQQMFRYEGNAWKPMEGTSQKREFDEWIKDNLGLGYDTFTSSVLLLQGKAEKLLDSKPEGRREVLASIVDLDRYARLHQKADECRKTQEGALKTLASRLQALPAVLPLEVQEARNQIDEAEETRAQARGEVERLQRVVYEARGWQELQQRLVQTRLRAQKARSVLGDAAAIEQAVERLRDLRQVIPRLNEIAVMRGQGHQAIEQIRILEGKREKQAALVLQKESAVRQTRDRRQTLHGQIARDEGKHREIAAKLRSSEKLLVTLRECERQESDLARLRKELETLPADPAGLVSAAREVVERLDGLARVQPALLHFQARRSDLTEAAAQEKASEQSMQEVRARGEARKVEVEQLKPRLEEAVATLLRTTDQATEARTLLAQARDSLDELHDLDGAKVCRHCGQALTPGHLVDEKRRRTKEVQAAENRLKQATQTLEQARRAEAELRQELDLADKAYQEARQEYRDQQLLLKTARASLVKLQDECRAAHGELPEPWQARISPGPVADWLTTTFPTEKDVTALRTQLRELDPARRKLRDLEQVLQRHGTLMAKQGQARENLERMLRELPADREGLLRDHADLDAQEKALTKSVDACRQQVEQVEKELDRLMRERDQTQAEAARLDTQIKEQQLIEQTATRNISGQTKLLPATWQGQAETVGIKQVSAWKAELAHLEQEGTEERGRELEQARHNVTVLEQDVAQLQKQEEGYPPEMKQEPTRVATLLAEAKQRDRDCDEKLGKARERLALLENNLAQRQQLDREYRDLEKQLQSHRLLAELLGRERLQLYLVRQAERQVVEYANAVLDRLSGGQLYLKLSGEANGEGSTAKALDLEAYNRSTGERPINVAFLSGSQKFRVAVSLALGIGQYASRQHRPIESVIIDEGFGCLDSQGRQVMIQELQNLRSQMRCILLVSHQEDFAEAFADGYQFKLVEGATKVERFRR